MWRNPVPPRSGPLRRPRAPVGRTGSWDLATGNDPTVARHVARSRWGREVCETDGVNTAVPAPRVIAVVGPTAAGKSDLGVALAQQLGGEVINADSMQLYRGMDIGTAKLTPEEQQGVPHHLLDIWDVTVRRQRRRVPAAGPRRDRPAARRGPHPGPGRRLRPVRPRRHRRPGLPRHRPGGARPAGGRTGRARQRRAARPAGRRRPRGGPRDPAEQRPPHRPRPGGHRDHRPALHRQPPRPRSGLRHPPDRRRRRRAPNSTSGSPGGSTGCGRRAWSTRCARLEARGAARGPYGLPGARLPAGARRAGGGVHRAGGARRDRARHQALRAPPGLVVPPGPAGPLAQRRRRATGRNFPARRWRCSNDRSQPDHVMASGRSGRHPGP